MFNMNQDYTVHDIYLLMSSGVNIFNVDRTTHDDKLFEALKQAVRQAVKMPEMYPPLYLRPVGLSVTMSITEPVEVDEGTDIIILKNVSNEDQVLKYKRRNMKLGTPILLQISEYCTDKLTEFIKIARHSNPLVDVVLSGNRVYTRRQLLFVMLLCLRCALAISDGIVFDFSKLSNAVITKVSKLCKKYEKPLFYLKFDMFKLANHFDDKRKLMAVANELVDSLIDGVVITGNYTIPQLWATVFLNIVQALKCAEDICDLEKAHSMLRMNTKSPQMTPITLMIAASIAVLKTNARAIILFTASGRSARMLASLAPPCPVLAITARDSVVRHLHLYRKVIPLHYEGRRAVNWREEYRNRVRFGTEFAVRTGLLCGGAKLVVLAPFEEGAGCCDSFQIVTAPL